MIARLRRDEGITTAELIVAMAIGTILGMMTLAVILGLSKASDASIERSEMSTTARTALDSWTNLLAVRESPVQDESDVPSIEQISTDSITFYAAIDNRPLGTNDIFPSTRIVVRPEGRGIVEERYDPANPDEQVTSRLLVADGSLTLRAFRGDGRSIALPSVSDENLSGAQRAAIDRVDITMTVRDDKGHTYTYGGGNDVPTAP